MQLVLSPDAKSSMKAHVNGILLSFHMWIYRKDIVGFTPSDLKLQVPQPSITYAFAVNIYFYGRSCVATRPPFTFSHIRLGKK